MITFKPLVNTIGNHWQTITTQWSRILAYFRARIAKKKQNKKQAQKNTKDTKKPSTRATIQEKQKPRPTTTIPHIFSFSFSFSLPLSLSMFSRYVPSTVKQPSTMHKTLVWQTIFVCQFNLPTNLLHFNLFQCFLNLLNAEYLSFNLISKMLNLPNYIKSYNAI